MGIWKRIERIKWIDRVSNEEVLDRIEESGKYSCKVEGRLYRLLLRVLYTVMDVSNFSAYTRGVWYF